ncbi:hypothetical protein EDB80DRAFT_784411 [Ilyonectria destructans]|nr:hypothetical protein EDB80DRAFT_784411 [Ilyonectria destructans]
MSSKNDEKAEKAEKAELATNLSDFPRPQKSNSTSVPYPSPSNSPPQTKARISQAPRVSGDRARPAGAVSPPLSPPTTPPRQSSASTIHQKQPAKEKVNAATLKTCVVLDIGRCGALTRSGRPCRSWSPAANRAGVTSQLESMINLTQSSIELEAALDKLVMLVHCNNHDTGLPKKSRRISRRRSQYHRPGHYTKEQPMKLVAMWKSSIVEIREEYLIKSAESGAYEGTGGPSGALNT